MLATRTAAAAPGCDARAAEAEAAGLRVHLLDEAARAHRWNVGWGLGFGAVSAVQLGLAVGEWNPLGAFNRDDRDALYVGAGKAAIGALGRLVTPLRIRVPAPTADPCADVSALRAVLARSGKLERTLFWTSHLGSLVVNLGGTVILGEQTGHWTLAALTFVYSYPVGLLAAYTMPRGSWHAWRALEATALAPVPLPGGGVALTLAGEF